MAICDSLFFAEDHTRMMIVDAYMDPYLKKIGNCQVCQLYT